MENPLKFSKIYYITILHEITHNNRHAKYGNNKKKPYRNNEEA